jgi:hypothetical protein
VDKKPSLNYEELFSEIINGFSLYIIDKHNIYFKHPTITENYQINSKYKIYLDQGKKKGLLTEEEKVLEAIDGGWWSNEKETEIRILRRSRDNLKKTRANLMYPSQKAGIDKQIQKVDAILITLIKERNEITNYTAEDYASNRFIDELIVQFAYKDDSLKEKFFSNFDDYYEISEDFFDKIRKTFNVYQTKISEGDIKLLSASGAFQNLVYLTDNPESFWGKTLLDCTKYQIDILIYGKLYRNTIKSYAESGSPVPEEVLQDPEKFLIWLEDQNQKNVKAKNSSSKKSKGKNAVSSYVGANADDLEKMGVRVEKFKGKSILDLAKEKGGKLEKHDYLKVRESL